MIGLAQGGFNSAFVKSTKDHLHRGAILYTEVSCQLRLLGGPSNILSPEWTF